MPGTRTGTGSELPKPAGHRLIKGGLASRMGYIGTSKVALDPKARLAIPTRYREPLREQCQGRMTITRGPLNQLWLFPAPVWDEFYLKLLGVPAADPTRMRFLTNADPVDMDGGGRILIPAGLRAKGLLPNANVAFLGNGTFFELWDWEEHLAYENSQQQVVSSSALSLSI